MDLMKARFARSHKYVYRTGTPGNYKYFYKLRSGEIVSGTDAGINERTQKNQHIERLLAGREAGIHSMSNSQIARQVGVTQDAVRSQHNRIRRGQENDFQPHELKEALHGDISGANMGVYRNHLREAHGEPVAREWESRPHETPSPARPSDPPVSATATADPAPAAGAAPDPDREPGGAIFTSESPEGAALRTRHRLTSDVPITSSGHYVPADPAPATEAASPSESAAPTTETTAQQPQEAQPQPQQGAQQDERSARIAELVKKLKEVHGWNPGDDSVSSVKESSQRIQQVTGQPAAVRKGFTLVVKSDEVFTPRDTLRKTLVVSKSERCNPSEIKDARDGFVVDIRKAERIEKIRNELTRRGIRT